MSLFQQTTTGVSPDRERDKVPRRRSNPRSRIIRLTASQAPKWDHSGPHGLHMPKWLSYVYVAEERNVC